MLKIELLRKYKKDGFVINLVPVYPAGLRDYTVTDGSLQKMKLMIYIEAY